MTQQDKNNLNETSLAIREALRKIGKEKARELKEKVKAMNIGGPTITQYLVSVEEAHAHLLKPTAVYRDSAYSKAISRIRIQTFSATKRNAAHVATFVTPTASQVMVNGQGNLTNFWPSSIWDLFENCHPPVKCTQIEENKKTTGHKPVVFSFTFARN